MELKLFLIGLKQTRTMLEQYFLNHLFLDKMSTTKSHFSTRKWMESRWFLYGLNKLEQCLNDTLCIISFKGSINP